MHRPLRIPRALVATSLAGVTVVLGATLACSAHGNDPTRPTMLGVDGSPSADPSGTILVTCCFPTLDGGEINPFKMDAGKLANDAGDCPDGEGARGFVSETTPPSCLT